MARNVLRQLGTFYDQRCPAFWLGQAIDITRNYRRTVAAFDPPNYQSEMLAYAPAREYLATSRSLAATPSVYREAPAFSLANTLAAETQRPLLIALAAGWALLLCLPFPGLRRQLAPAGALALLFFAYTFGNCLTVAIVHSMDIDRYSSNLVIFTILSAAAALTWGVEALLYARFRLNPELYDLNLHSPAADASFQR
jgi:hypothetical protein